MTKQDARQLAAHLRERLRLRGATVEARSIGGREPGGYVNVWDPRTMTSVRVGRDRNLQVGVQAPEHEPRHVPAGPYTGPGWMRSVGFAIERELEATWKPARR